MTNKEISQADVLDILFENRNKAYGAYALRRNYNHRMQWALGICLGVALLLVMLNYLKLNGGNNNPDTNDNSYIISSVDLPEKDKPKEPEKPKPQQQPKTATQQVTTIQITENENTVPTEDDIKNKQISTHTTDGIPDDGTPKKNEEPVKVDGDGTEKTKEPAPVLPSFAAAFPGGVEAFTNFLKKYLVTPDELEIGEKRTVLVRFMVDVDGSISKAEIVESGGSSFDKEVLRVLRKMPKWVPAQQNGMKVSSYFTQPVTFMAIEQ